MVSPLGKNVKESWQRLKQGISGIRPLTRFNPEELGADKDFCRIAGEVRNFDLSKLVTIEDLELVGLKEKFSRNAIEQAKGIGIGTSEIKKMSYVFQLAIAATIEALKDAKLNLSKERAWERGTVIGSGLGGGREFEIGVDISRSKGLRRIPPRSVLQILLSTISGELARYTGSRGPSDAVSTACASGNHAIIKGCEYILNKEAEIAIVGATESPLTPYGFGVGIFDIIKALSHRNDEPEKASRPFDINRDGFVPSEGAGFLILEELERALKRGAPIYGEIVGYARTTDAYHETRGEFRKPSSLYEAGPGKSQDKLEKD